MASKPTYIELEKRVKGFEKEELKRKQAEKRQQFQKTFAIEVSKTKTLTEALKTILKHMFKLDEFDSGGIYLIDEKTDGLDLIVHQGLPQMFIDKVKHYDLDDIRSQMILKGEPIYQTTSEFPSPLTENLDMDGILSLAVIPIKYGEKVIGSINLASHTHTVITDYSMSILEMITEVESGVTIYRVIAEEALRESEKKYRAIVEDQTELICRFKPDFTLTFVNESYARNWGKTPGEMIGVNFLTLIPEHAHETVLKHFNSFSPVNNLKSQEHEVIDKIGGLRWQQWSNRSFFDDEDNIVEFQSVGRDITQRKQAEETLRKSEARFRDIASSIPGVIYQFLLKKDGSYSSPYISESASSILDISAKEIIANPYSLFDRILKEDLDSVNKSIIESARTMKTWFQEFRIKTKAGDVKWIRGISIPHQLPDDEILWNGVILDISDRVLAQEALRESEKRFRNFLENLGDVAYETDSSGNVTYGNKMSEVITGRPLRDIIGKSFLPLFTKESQEIAIDVYQRTLNGESMEFELTLTNGRICHFKNQPLSDESGKITGVFGIARDITERKEMEEMLLKAKNELEQRVEKRTAELKTANKALQVEKENLEEVNTALRVMINKRDQDKIEIEENVLYNVKILVSPYLDKLCNTTLDDTQKELLGILESNLNEIISSFSRNLSIGHMGLTMSEIEVTNLIRQDNSTKKIAALLNLSNHTIETYRKNIRKKLRINNKKINLSSYLKSMQ